MKDTQNENTEYSSRIEKYHGKNKKDKKRAIKPAAAEDTPAVSQEENKEEEVKSEKKVLDETLTKRVLTPPKKEPKAKTPPKKNIYSIGGVKLDIPDDILDSLEKRKKKVVSEESPLKKDTAKEEKTSKQNKKEVPADTGKRLLKKKDDEASDVFLSVSPKEEKSADPPAEPVLGNKESDTPDSAEDLTKESKNGKSKAGKKTSGAAKAWVITLLVIAAVLAVLLIFVFEIVTVEGFSMEPTLSGGEKIVVDKVSRYSEFPARGQMIVTGYDGYDGYYIKRIIAFPGEWVEIYDSTVYINGEVLEEPYIGKELEYEDMELMQVVEGCVFLLGDNRELSLDSRMETIGCVPAENILGNAYVVIWPFESIRMIQ